MSDPRTFDPAYAPPPSRRWSRGAGIALCVIGGAWLLVGLWAILFVRSEDRGGTELVTAVFNLAIPVILTLPSFKVLGAGLARVGPLRLGERWRDLRGRLRPMPVAETLSPPIADRRDADRP